MPRLKSPKGKGDDYERELAEFFNTVLLPDVHRRREFRRAVLSGGGVSDSVFDLTGTEIMSAGFQYTEADRTVRVEGCHFELGIEAKRTERVNVHEAMAQALRHLTAMAGRGYDVTRVLPMVVTRRNRQATADSLVVMPLWALVKLIRGD
jgi:hypothetical protein